jgi:hypothetical protein
MSYNRIFAPRFVFLSGGSAEADELAPVFDDKEGLRRPPLTDKNFMSSQDGTSRRRRKSARSRSNIDGKSGHSEGLCTNCENRLQCTMRSQEGGVWHCEEYQ